MFFPDTTDHCACNCRLIGNSGFVRVGAVLVLLPKFLVKSPLFFDFHPLVSIALPPEGFGASIGPAQDHGRINAFAVRLLERSGPEVVPDPDDGHPDEVEMLEPSRLHLELPAEIFIRINAGVDRIGGGMGRGGFGPDECSLSAVVVAEASGHRATTRSPRRHAGCKGDAQRDDDDQQVKKT